MKTITTLTAIGLVALSACAPAPDQIAPTPTSATIYGNLSCSQISAEQASVISQLNPLVQAQQTAADNDSAAMGIGLILFWPAALLAAGGPDYQAQIAGLRGQINALNTAALQRGC